MPVKSNKRKNSTENTFVDTFIKTFLFSVLIYMLVFLIFCVIAYISDLSDKYDYIFSLLSFVISSFITGFYSGKKLRKNGLLYGALFSLPINSIVILISLIINNFSVTANIMTSVVLMIASAGIGGVVAVNSRYRRRG